MWSPEPKRFQMENLKISKEIVAQLKCESSKQSKFVKDMNNTK